MKNGIDFNRRISKITLDSGVEINSEQIKQIVKYFLNK